MAEGNRDRPTPLLGPRADWDKWSQILTCELWQAVALSLEIEPDAMPGVNFRPINGGPFDDCPAEFRRRLEIADNHVQSGALGRPAYAGNRTREIVKLSELATWAQSRGWSLPDALLDKSARTRRRPKTAAARLAYEAHVAEFRAEHGRDPPLQTTKEGILGDREWATQNGISRDTVTRFRREMFGRKIGGRPKNQSGNSAGS